jgi:hypothetical protein
MAELRETHVIRERIGGRATPWLAFLVGALMIAAVAFFFMYARGSIHNGPNGQTIEFSVKPQVPAPPTNANTR